MIHGGRGHPIYQFTQNNYIGQVTGNVNTGTNSGSMHQERHSPTTRPDGGEPPQNPKEKAVSRRTEPRRRVSILAVIYAFLLPVSSRSRKPKQCQGLIAMVSMDEGVEPPPRSHGPAPRDIYTRMLLREGHGLPRWEPKPLEPEAQPKGIVPGDVGTLTSEGGFRRSFNLFDDACEIGAITRTILGADGKSVDSDILREGENLVYGASANKLDSLDPLGTIYEFHCDPSASAGAVLALTSSADGERTSDIDGMEKYIHEHAEAIYRHAFGVRPISEKESLYIVTGCIKSDSWAMAAFDEGAGGIYSTLRLVPGREAKAGEPPTYRWDKEASHSRTRAGKSSRNGVKDQSLFLQGFRLSFSPDFHSRVRAGSLGSGDSDSSGAGTRGGEEHNDHHGAASRGSSPGNGRGGGPNGGPTSGQTTSSSHGRNHCALSYGPSSSFPNKHETIHTNDTQNTLGKSSLREEMSVYDAEPEGTAHPYHPSDAINALLLQQTGCDIAVCHDDSWRFLLKLCYSLCVESGGVLAQEALCKRIGELGNRTIGTKNGVAFLLPEGGNASENIQALTSAPQGVCTSNETLNEEGSNSNEVPMEQARVRMDEHAEKQRKGRLTPEIRHEASPQSQPPPPPSNMPNNAALSNGSKPPVSPPSLQLCPTDIVVLVMGIVGAGRSTFINALLPANSMDKKRDVGTSLTACTRTAECTILNSDDLAPILGHKPKYRLVLVDTPGFDLADTSDSKGVLKEIIAWSKTRLPHRQKCSGGVVFVHDLSADRLLQGQSDLVTVSNTLKSRSASAQVVIVTSKWEYVASMDEGDRRHSIVQEKLKPAKVHKFQRGATDAREIMKDLLLHISEQGAELDFQAFNDMKVEKKAKEKSYKKNMKKVLQMLFRPLKFWRQR